MQNIFICIQMCLSSVWTQSPYNDKNPSTPLFIPQKPSLNFQDILAYQGPSHDC